jgi:methylthioribose-1-phosphate isomerase
MRLDEINDGLLLWGLPSRQGVAAIKKRVEATQGLYVLVPEMRPTLLGLEIAKTLKKKSIKHVYATDNMVGILFFKNKVKEILFFYKDYRDQHF